MPSNSGPDSERKPGLHLGRKYYGRSGRRPPVRRVTLELDEALLADVIEVAAGASPLRVLVQIGLQVVLAQLESKQTAALEYAGDYARHTYGDDAKVARVVLDGVESSADGKDVTYFWSVEVALPSGKVAQVRLLEKPDGRGAFEVTQHPRSA